MKKILVTGSVGQIGSELVPALRAKYGNENVIATGYKTMPGESFRNAGPFEIVDVMDKDSLRVIIEKYDIDTIYHLVSVLSAMGEKNPNLAWDVNMITLKNVLDLAKEYEFSRVFWASSIAAFGPSTPKDNTPQLTVMDPNTMYGLTKVAGELLCNYYFVKHGVDVRSLRYPGIISYKTLPGGGTTDYAVEIFYEALKNRKYACFLKEDATLPMMHMPDAIKATIDIMQAEPSKIKTRTSYNLAAVSFSPKEIAEEIKKHIPEFECTYEPDFRQKIAESWPKVIDDSSARNDWGWKHEFGLAEMTKDMLEKLGEKLGVNL
ncbi:MAG: NAD-dependent epimerase/dehydratase family protein [Candidatus Aenigmarchaeota archaeon]|nr:NAD-dependent epimerase/dehydratase family protein [Candidatus Aenigmarchaeota archaeon]MCK4531396.1 NAD-dependent epimerase/dehydratase family protein [Candidatus Aenigmarchaeota archaeon]